MYGEKIYFVWYYFYDTVKKPPQCWRLTPVILAIQEAEIRRISVWSQPGQIVHKTLSQKYPSQKRTGGVTQGVGRVQTPVLQKKIKTKTKKLQVVCGNYCCFKEKSDILKQSAHYKSSISECAPDHSFKFLFMWTWNKQVHTHRRLLFLLISVLKMWLIYGTN
jgi:hypothetical protein